MSQAGEQKGWGYECESNLRMKIGHGGRPVHSLWPPSLPALLGSFPPAPNSPGFSDVDKTLPWAWSLLFCAALVDEQGVYTRGAQRASGKKSAGAEQMPALLSLLQVLQGAVPSAS